MKEDEERENASEEEEKDEEEEEEEGREKPGEERGIAACRMCVVGTGGWRRMAVYRHTHHGAPAAH